MFKSTKIYKFYDQVKQEALRVVWPSKKELSSSTLIVVGVLLVFSIFFLVLDYSIYSVVHALLRIGK